MKSDTTKTQSYKIHGKDVFFYFIPLIGYLFIGSIFFLWEHIAELPGIVLLYTSLVSIGNAVYYGLIWKDLNKTARRSLFVFFFLIGLAGLLLYIFSPLTAKSWELFFTVFIGSITCLFIYKHKNPSFWSWF